MTKHDATFLRHFSMIIAGLMVFTVFLILFANYIYAGFTAAESADGPSERQVAQMAKVDERLTPIGGVYAGETGRAAMLAAAEAARAAAASKVAYGGTLDGSVIYGNLCGACHNAGVGGAPKMEMAAWNARIAQGMDVMVRHAIEGFQGDGGIMPARGGNPSLTDEQITVTVQYMVDTLQ